MRDNDHGMSFFFGFSDDIEYFSNHFWIKRAGRFIKEDDLWV